MFRTARDPLLLFLGLGATAALRTPVKANSIRSERIFVIAPPGAVSDSRIPAAFRVRDGRDTVTTPTKFLAGEAR